MKRNMVFGVLLLVVFVLQAQTLFAADYNADFVKALSENNLTKAEDILRKRSARMDLGYCIRSILNKSASGLNEGNVIQSLQLLKNYGANMDANYKGKMNTVLDADGYTPLHCVLDHSIKWQNTTLLQIVDYLISNGANVNRKFSLLAVTTDGNVLFQESTPLSRAIGINNVEVARLLVSKGADVNSTDFTTNQGFVSTKEPFTLLMFAINLKGNFNIIQLLVANGAKVNLRDEKGRTAASIAYDKGEIEIYNYLKANGAIDFEPRQITQQPAAPPPSYAPPPSSSGGSSSSRPSAPATPVLQAGTYACSGTNHTMTLIRITDTSGTVTYYVGGSSVGFGTYAIRNNQLMLSFTSLSLDGLKGKSFIYPVTSATSFSGSGENWGKR